MKKTAAILITAAFMIQSPVFADTEASVDIYAAPWGSDIYGNGTYLNPYRSIEKITQKAKLMIRTGTQKDIKVILREGEYTLDRTISFDYLTQNNYEGTLTYKSYNNEEVSILGASRGYSWENIGNGIYKTNVENEVNVIYENGETAIKARYPNRGEKRSDGYLSAAYDGTSRNLYFNYGDFPVVADQTDLQIYLWAGGDHMVYALDNPGVSVDYSQNVVTLDWDTANSVPIRAGSRYYMQSAIEFLDMPGEMYYSSNEKALYYMPYDADNLEDIYIPAVNTAVNIGGISSDRVSNIAFEGIAFKYFGTDKTNPSSVIYTAFCDDITIKDCEISECGGNGIYAYYTDNSVFSGNRIENIGGVGVTLRESDKPQNVGNNLVYNNYIKNIGLYDAESSGISITTTSSNKILNNTISETPRASVSMGTGNTQLYHLLGTVVDGVVITRENAKPYLTCNDNIIRYNDFSRAMLETNDGGLFYCWGAGYDNDISYNYFHDLEVEFSFAWAVYLDDDCSKETVTNNFIENCRSGDGDLRNVLFVKGQDNLIENNFIINCECSQGILRVDSQSGAGPVGNAVFRKNLIYNSGNHMYGFYSYNKAETGGNRRFAECDYNLFYNAENNSFDVLCRNEQDVFVKMADANTWRNEYLLDVNSSFKMPEFADPFARDYRLMLFGNAARLGISNVDISNAGVTKEYKYSEDSDIDKVYINTNDISNAALIMSVGEEKQLYTTVKSAEGFIQADAEIDFVSSDTQLLTVDKNGKAVAKGKGTVCVTAAAQKDSKLCTAELYITIE